MPRSRKEAGHARADPAMLSAFQALRLNLGTSDVMFASLLDSATWEASKATHGSWSYGLGR